MMIEQKIRNMSRTAETEGTAKFWLVSILLDKIGNDSLPISWIQVQKQLKSYDKKKWNKLPEMRLKLTELPRN